MIIEDCYFCPKDGTSLAYVLTAPTDFDPAKESLPLIVFLHGSGERGTDLSLVRIHGVPKLFTKDVDYHGLRVLTVSPQYPLDTLCWYDYKEAVCGLIADLTEKYNVDPDAVTLTGISMGGYGTWEIAMTHPDLFAAIAPICGGGTHFRVGSLVNVPAYVFHGALDDCVPVSCSEIMVEWLKRAGGTVEFTVYPDLNHNCWERAYETTDLIEKLAAARRK